MDHAAAFSERIEELRSGLDRTSFDPDALALELVFEDPETIVAWMQEQIAFEAYEGLLRGPHGTLIAGAGNALDQAVLLARLLQDAGFEAEVVQGSLDDDQTTALLATLGSPTSRGPTFGAVAMESAVDGLVAFAAGDGITIDRVDLDPRALASSEPLDASTLLDVERHAAALIAAIGAEADGWQRTGTGEGLELAREASKEYFWVEYRVSPSDPWIEAHPALGIEATPSRTIAGARRFAGAVPSDLVHKVRFEVEIAVKRGDRVTWTPVIDPWERPAANLAGGVFSFANVADNAEAIQAAQAGLVAGREGADEALAAAMAATTFYFPFLNGQQAPGAMAFDGLGNVAPFDVATDPAAGVFAEVARGMGEAAGAIGGLGANTPIEAAALVAQRVVYTIVAPGGRETRHERVVFDRAQGGDPAAGLVPIEDLAGDLLATHSTMVTTARPSAPYLLDRIYASLLDVRDELANFGAVVDARTDAPEEIARELARSLMSGAEPLELDLLLLADALEGGVLDGAIAYRSAPSIVSMRVAIASGRPDTAEVLVDIVSNPRHVLRRDGTAWVASPSDQVWLGVRDTYVEWMMLQGVAGYDTDAPAVGTAIAMLEDLPTADLLVLRGTTDDEVGRLRGDERSMAAVRADLARGFVVVLPDAPLVYEQATWWRIDPSTGETLGIMRGGEGVAVEWLKVASLTMLVAHVAVGIVVYVTCRLALGLLRAVDEITGGPPYRPPSATCLPGAIVGGAFGAKGPLLALLTTVLMIGLGIEDPPPSR